MPDSWQPAQQEGALTTFADALGSTGDWVGVVHDLTYRPQTVPRSHERMHAADDLESRLTLVTSCRKVLCTGSICRRGTLVSTASRFHSSDMPIGSSTSMLRHLQVVVSAWSHKLTYLEQFSAAERTNRHA